MGADQPGSVQAAVETTLRAATDSGDVTDLDAALMATVRTVARHLDAAEKVNEAGQTAMKLLYLLRELRLTPKARGPQTGPDSLAQFLAEMQASAGRTANTQEEGAL